MPHLQRSDYLLFPVMLQTWHSSGAQEPFEKIQPLFAAGLEKFLRKKIWDVFRKICVKLLKQLFKLIHRPVTGGVHCFVRSLAYCRPISKMTQ